MFCSKCGTEIQTKLNYCNKCGNKISKSELESMFAEFDFGTHHPHSQSLSTAIGFIGLGGMIAIVIFALKLLDRNVDIGAVVIIIALFLATILAIIFMLIRQMSREKEKPALPEASSEEYRPPKSLGAVNTNQLEEPSEVPASVTEHTTRVFEKTRVGGE